jgi:ribosome-associated toxin RatA of RatAB toxin-antitoxin module
MSGVVTEHVFSGAIGKVFLAFSSYEDYPAYIPYVQSVKVLPPKVPGAACLARYELNLIKQFFYTLNIFHNEPNLIRWELDESDLLKTSSGSWQLSAQGKTKTKAIYTVEVEPKMFVPKMLVNQLTKTALPATLEGFQQLIDAKK